MKVRDGRLRVPGFGPLAIRRKDGNPCPGGKPVSPVLKRADGRWHAMVCLPAEVEAPADNGRVVGPDRNGGQVADSDGEITGCPTWRGWRRGPEGCSGSRPGSARPAGGASGPSGTCRGCAARSPTGGRTGITT